MYCTVHRLRENGRKLSNPAAGVVGHLSIEPHTLGSNDRESVWAQLLRDDGTPALLPLHRAQVRRITAAGILIIGSEPLTRSDSIKARIRWARQTWWCVVTANAEAKFMAAVLGPPRG